MARIESIAVGGYFPTPENHLERIAGLVRPSLTSKGEGYYEPEFSVMDPCGGEGTAVLTFMKLWGLDNKTKLYGCELEPNRYLKFKEKAQESHWSWTRHILKGDAFYTKFERNSYQNPGVNVLWLNPPYGLDPQHGRLEHKFLTRFSPALEPGGLLMWCVPYYAIPTSAEYLAQHFDNIQVLRFANREFEGFKQVVLYGVLRDEPYITPPQSIVDKLLQWGHDIESLVQFPNHPQPIYHISPKTAHSGILWEGYTLDIETLTKKSVPWTNSGKGMVSKLVTTVLPDIPIQDSLLRRYPVATPHRPAHIASAIAAGVFNGARVTSHNPNFGPLLVKGVFTQEYRTVETKEDKDGKVSEIQIQQPRLDVNILDLESKTYKVLEQEGSNTSVDTLSVSGLLNLYGESLMRTMQYQCPVEFDPKRDGNTIELAPFSRKPFTAQANVTKALVHLLGGKNAKRLGRIKFLLGEIGSGKTGVALHTARTIGANKMLVLCPPHLLDSWRNEVRSTLPHYTVKVLQDVTDLEYCEQHSGPLVAVLSRETAKLTHGWVGSGSICPTCGARSVVKPEHQATRRLICGHKSLTVTSPLGQWCLNQLEHLAQVDPNNATIETLFISRWDSIRLRHYRMHLEDRESTDPYPFSIDFSILKPLLDQDLSDKLKETIAWCCIAQNSDQFTESVIHQLLTNNIDYLKEELAKWLIASIQDPIVQDRLVQKYKKDDRYSAWYSIGRDIDEAKSSKDPIYRFKLGTNYLELNPVKFGSYPPGSIGAVTQALEHLCKFAKFRLSAPCEGLLYGADQSPRRVALAQHIQTRYPKVFDFLTIDECFVAGTLIDDRPIETIRVGDSVTAWSEATNTVQNGEVVKLYRKRPTGLVQIRLENGYTLVCTPNHPVMTQGGWKPAGLLFGDDSMFLKMEISRSQEDRNLRSIRVDSVEILEPGSDGRYGGLCPDGYVYNFEVKEHHTYFANSFLVHNCHEFSGEGSAQGLAGLRLMSLRIPTILMTGSIMNGYAKSLFNLTWAAIPGFRERFTFKDREQFVTRYGYRKRILTEKDLKTSEVLARGAQSDRVETNARIIGDAPGILPLYLLEFLLPNAVTLQKEDLNLELPPCTQQRIPVQPTAEQSRIFKKLTQTLVDQIRKDQKDPERYGKLLGQLAELPSYLDRCTSDVGNNPDGTYRVKYPESLDNEIVMEVDGFDPDTILPKERWMLDTIRDEIEQNRNIMVFGWHTGLLPRLQRLIESHLGHKAPILWSDKVQPAKRQEWIDKTILKARRRIMIANPVGIQTGLNNLVHFSTQLWLENPAANPVTYRQALGRVDRIGQTLPTRILFPVYTGTLQEKLHELLLHKVQVSTATDGLDSESALLASGVGDTQYLTGLSLGKQLWALLNQE